MIQFVCMQKETTLRELKKVEVGFEMRKEFLEEKRAKCIEARDCASKEATLSIRAYANLLMETAMTKSKTTVGVLEACRRLRVCCNKLDRFSVD